MAAKSRIIACMANKKKTTSDRHKRKALQLRMHALLRQQLERLVERNASTLTAEITTAVRERLEKHNLWPIPDDEK